MTFNQLRSRATAAETCLIDTVILMVEKEIREKTLFKFWDFIKANPAPSREDMQFNPEASKNWFARLEKHLTPPEKGS